LHVNAEMISSTLCLTENLSNVLNDIGSESQIDYEYTFHMKVVAPNTIVRVVKRFCDLIFNKFLNTILSSKIC